MLLWSKSVCDTNTIGCDDLLSFCRNKKDEFPKIAAIARVLPIPASDTSVERLFSATKITVSDRRAKLCVEKIVKLSTA